MTDPQPYSKVARSTWGDVKFRALSERSQYLWLYLLTGPHCTSIPGVLPNVGIGTIADALKWPASRVRKHFAEIEAAGMAIADWSANVIVLPNGVLYNEPANPNVITSWRRIPLPQCDLIIRALRAIRVILSVKEDPKPWTDAFDDAFRKQFPKGFAEPFPEGLPQPGSGTTTAKQDQGSGSGPLTGTGRVEPVQTAENATGITPQDTIDAITFRQVNSCPHVPPCGDETECVDYLSTAIAVHRFQIRKFAN